MLTPDGLRRNELPAYHRALTASREPRFEVDILDMEQRPVTTITPQFSDAQVNFDWNNGPGVDRSLSVTLVDPRRLLQFDSDSPVDGVLYADRMIQIRHTLYVPELDRDVTCPVFTGPIFAAERSGEEVAVEAQSKEALAREGVPTLTLKKGMLAVDAIERILRERCGETRFAFPANPRSRLPKDVVVSWEEETWPWVVCHQLAKSINRQIYYDAAGVCRLRFMPDKPVFEFTQPGWVTSEVEVSDDFSQIRNHVRVTGSTPQHRASATAPKDHPYSPTRLGRNGVPRFLPLIIDDTAVGSKREAQARANSELDALMIQVLNVTFGAAAAYHLEPRDLCRIVTPDFAANFRWNQASVGTREGVMSVGYIARVSKPRRRVQRVRVRAGAVHSR